jgi:hypothetical protein
LLLLTFSVEHPQDANKPLSPGGQDGRWRYLLCPASESKHPMILYYSEAQQIAFRTQYTVIDCNVL